MNARDRKKYDEIKKDVGDKDVAMNMWLRWKALTDLYFFGSEIMGLENAADYRGRKRLDPYVHRQMARDLESDDDVLLLYPRGHMKTTWMKYRIMQMLLSNPNIRIGLWARTSSLVRNELKGIKTALLSPMLLRLFPDRIPKNRKKWEKDTADTLTLCRDPDMGSVPDENQIEVWGVDSTVTGRHYDFHFYDDLINEKSITTAQQIENVRIFWQHVQAIREVTATEKMVGTRYHQHDIYGEIIKDHHFNKYTVKRAIVNGKPYYKYFTMKDLMKMKQRMGEQVFSCQMLNEPVPMSDRLFTLPVPNWTNLPENAVYYITMDPSLGKKWSDQAGICVACIDEKKHDTVYFVEAYGVKMRTEMLAKEAVRLIYKYRPRRFGIEYGLQEGLQYAIDAELSKMEGETGIRHRPFFVPISTGKTKKATKIDRTIGAFTRMGRALFKEDMRDLFMQMEFFNPHSEDNDDDILDAAGMMIQTIEYFAQAHWFQDGQTNDAIWKPWFPTWDDFKRKPTSSWAEKFAS